MYSLQGIATESEDLEMKVKMVVEGISFADGNFYEVYTSEGLYIFSQYYCKYTGLYTYEVYDVEGKTYSFHTLGSKLANGQVLDEKLFTEMAAKAKVWRKFELKEGGFSYAIHS